MGTIRLTIAYDGGQFSGWQIQPDRRTVQGVVEEAIRELTGESVRVFSAGRTDAGVHALGQVAHFHSNFRIPPEKWRPALQSRLPDDVVILESAAADDEFHATFSATQKRYRYIIRLSLVEDPLLRRYAWRMNGSLDLDAMRSAAQSLLGQHDFRCFESDWPNKATSVRTIFDVSLTAVSRWPGWGTAPLAEQPPHQNNGEFVVFEISGDGFLYNMVRAIVGTLVNVGRGKWPVESLARIIAGQDRSLAGETAPAHGLYLVSVDYGGTMTG
ncbi:MAG: tRNA pseudouridine(38-40) synthase TruA [Planctomycetaceae bacterium]